jgi:hypothetical protein
VPITDGASAGLTAASVVRMKLFSWDAPLVFMLSGFSHPPPKPKTG